MGREERKRLKEKKRLMRKQQKEFIADERRSIRRQNKQEKEERAWQRRKFRKARFSALKDNLHSFFTQLFRKSETKTQLPVNSGIKDSNFQPVSSIFPEPKKVILHHQRDDLKEEKRLQQVKKKLLKQQRKTYLAEAHRSFKKEKQERKRMASVMRKQIHAARMEEIKHEFKSFLKHPGGKDEMDPTDKKIFKKIRREVRQQNIRNFMAQPKLMLHSILRFWQNRNDQLKAGVENIGAFVKMAKGAFSQKQLRKDYLKTVINSIGLFLLSFLLVYYVHQFATIFAARAFNIPTKLYSYRIDWPLYTYSYLYTRKALIVIFGMGPFVCLLLGIAAYRLFLWSRFRTVHLKIFALWTAFNAFNMFFGAYVVGVITRTGFIYTSEWLFLSNVFDVEEIVLMIVSIVVLLIAGYYSTKQFLYAANSAAIIEPKIRLIYVITAVIIPWLIGNLILYIVNIPKNPVELVLLYSTSALIIIPLFSNYNTTTMQMLKLPWTPPRFRLGYIYLIITILFIIGTRLLLKSGISFY